jgi:hypothetical protein
MPRYHTGGQERETQVPRQCLIITTLLLLTSSMVAAQAQVQSAAKHDDIKKLLALTGARAIGLRASAQVLEMYQKAHSEIPAEVWQEILHEAKARLDEFVVERLVPIYDKHLSHEDIKALIVFYESPLGTKLLQVMPQMSQESMIAGQSWGREFAESVQQKLVDRGLIK